MTISLETVPYATRNGVDLLIDVYRPADKPKAAVLLLHGGNQSAHSWDLVSLHLAAQEGVDPGPVTVLEEIKEALAQ